MLGIPTMLLVALAFVMAAAMGYQSSKSSVNILVDQLAAKSASNIAAQLKNYLATPHMITRINADALRLGTTDMATLFAKPEIWFLNQHRQFPTISDVYVGRRDGAISGIDRNEQHYTIKLTDHFPHRNFIALDTNGQRGKIVDANDYDSTTRDWYKQAVQQQGPIWSKIYVLKNKNKLGITAAQPAWDNQGNFAGVMGVNLTLDVIANYLRNNLPAKHSTVYILERDGSLVASSAAATLFTHKAGQKEPQRVKAEQADNPIIVASHRAIITQYGKLDATPPSASIKTTISNANYLIQLTRYQDEKGLDWLIVTAVNDIDFMTAVNANLEKTLAMGGLLLLIMLALGAFLSGLVAKPILSLCDTASRIANGQFGETVSLGNAPFEIKSLTESFNSMSRQLSVSFQALAQLNANLETKVIERTQDLAHAKREIEQAHQQTRDSIQYASLIQHALIPTANTLDQHFQESFAIWQPKDIVGGDIYLYEPLGNGDECLLFVIDCTGHGVPGAFVTMLVKAIEQQLITRMLKHPEQTISPARLLTQFNMQMQTLLRLEKGQGADVGFDGGIIYIDRRHGILRFSGAHTPLFILQAGELKMIQGDRHSVGYSRNQAEAGFSEHEIQLTADTLVYLTTDGLLDQNGGAKGFPMGKRRFKAFLTDYHHLPLAQQKEKLLDMLASYQGDQERNDDITVVAFRV